MTGEGSPKFLHRQREKDRERERRRQRERDSPGRESVTLVTLLAGNTPNGKRRRCESRRSNRSLPQCNLLYLTRAICAPDGDTPRRLPGPYSRRHFSAIPPRTLSPRSSKIPRINARTLCAVPARRDDRRTAWV